MTAPSSLMWDRAVLKVMKIKEMLAVESDRKKRLYLKRRLAGAMEWEANCEQAYLNELRRHEDCKLLTDSRLQLNFQ